LKLGAARDYIFRTISQVTLKCRGKGLDQGHAGKVSGGDRTPWMRIDGTDNYTTLQEIAWCVHAYGDPSPELEQWRDALSFSLATFAWRNEFEHSGLKRDACYLVRPDPYLAASNADQDAGTLQHYLDRIGVKP
jgi:hypothetical protein